MQAWYMDDDDNAEEDQRLPHRRQPDDLLPLAKLLGIYIYLHIYRAFFKKRLILFSLVSLLINFFPVAPISMRCLPLVCMYVCTHKDDEFLISFFAICRPRTRCNAIRCR